MWSHEKDMISNFNLMKDVSICDDTKGRVVSRQKRQPDVVVGTGHHGDPLVLASISNNILQPQPNRYGSIP